MALDFNKFEGLDELSGLSLAQKSVILRSVNREALKKERPELYTMLFVLKKLDHFYPIIPVPEIRKPVKAKQKRHPPGQTPCGTYTKYRLSCRCDLCIQANTDYMNEYRRKKREEKLALKKKKRKSRAVSASVGKVFKNHGTAATYKSGCHCDLCVEANRIYRKEYDKKRKEKKLLQSVKN